MARRIVNHHVEMGSEWCDSSPSKQYLMIEEWTAPDGDGITRYYSQAVDVWSCETLRGIGNDYIQPSIL